MTNEKTYSQDLKQTVAGIIVLFVLGLVIWGVSILLGYNKPNETVKRDPTQAEIDAWNKEINDCQNSDAGCEGDNRWGQ